MLRALTGDANSAFVVLSIAASAVTTVAIFGIIWRLAGQLPPLVAALLFATSANVWGHGLIASPRILLALVASVVVWLALETRWGRRDYGVLSVAVLAVGAGLRPDALPFFGLLWLYAAAARGWRTVLVGTLIGAAIVLGWLVPTIYSIGWPAYSKALTDSATFWAPRADDARAYVWTAYVNARLAAKYSVLTLGPVPTAFLVAGSLLLLARRDRAVRSWPMLWRLLLVWLAPALAFYVLVHVNESGHVLTIFPALTILAGIGLVELAKLGAGLVRRPGIVGGFAAAATAVAVLANAATFRTATQPEIVSLAYIRLNDRVAAAEPDTIRRFPLESTLVISLSRFRQLSYCAPDLCWEERLLSVLRLLGRYEDVPPVTIESPDGTRNVVIFDIDVEALDPSTMLERIELAPGSRATIAHVGAGDVIVLSHVRAIIVHADHTSAL